MRDAFLLSMNKKALIFLIILAAIAGGFFYFWYIWLPAQIAQEQQGPAQVSTTTPPTLFGKEDYKIEERADGKYIVVPKVGLTAKVPEGWKVEKEGNDIPKPEYWINLYSPEVEFKSMKTILQKGCKISIKAGMAEENVKKIKEHIRLLQEYPEESDELKKEYVLAEDFGIIKISNYQSLKITSLENSVMGQTINIKIPIGEKKLITFSIGFPLEYKGKCSSIWEKFLKNIKID